jgi:CheY-like chemotaxis protein
MDRPGPIEADWSITADSTWPKEHRMAYRILLVDDEPNVLNALVRALRKEPYEFATALSAAEAIETMARAPVDVVISDERMPGMAGTEFLGRVRASYPDTIRMMLTGMPDASTAKKALSDGAVFRYFLKPFDPLEIGRAIYDALLLRALSGGDGLRLMMPLQAQHELIDRLEGRTGDDPVHKSRALPTVVRWVVEQLRNDLLAAQSKQEVTEVFASIRQLLGKIQAQSQRDQVIAVFKATWDEIEPRINR